MWQITNLIFDMVHCNLWFAFPLLFVSILEQEGEKSNFLGFTYIVIDIHSIWLKVVALKDLVE
jgi:hypothetical protein